jgi:hypothetical protein
MDVKEGNGTDSGKPSNEEAEAITRARSNGARSRKPYQKPAFRFERVFETMALSCGKVGSLQQQCRGSNQAS